MPIVSEFAEEKLELEKLIKSGIFDRSPGLAQVLTYICSKYFAGETEEIKEYNIGVDALGRSPDFDQKRDSIVRVQVHRLRERLADYYKGDGAGHHTQIEIPQGQYIPSFVTRDDAAAVEESRPSNREMAEPATQVPAAPPPVSRKPFAIAGFAILVILLVATIVLILREQHSTRAATAAGQVGAGVAGDPGGVTGDSLRILVGLTDYEYTDGFGHRWLTDRYFEGGSIAPALNQRILGTRDQRIYQTPRHGLFSYHIPLKAGIYELRLHFAETQYGETNPTGIGGELTRVFGILVNGQQVMERLDVIGESGPSMADVKVFKDISPGADGILDLTFQPRNSVPFLNGSENTPGRLHGWAWTVLGARPDGNRRGSSDSSQSRREYAGPGAIHRRPLWKSDLYYSSDAWTLRTHGLYIGEIVRPGQVSRRRRRFSFVRYPVQRRGVGPRF
jgi:hypothetical protein